MLRVVHDPNVYALSAEHVLQRIHGAGTGAGAVVGAAFNVQAHAQSGCPRIRRVNVNRLDTVLTPTFLILRGGQVLVRENVPQLLRGHLPALSVGAFLHDLGELNLGAARQIQPVLALQQVRHPALAGL